AQGADPQDFLRLLMPADCRSAGCVVAHRASRPGAGPGSRACCPQVDGERERLAARPGHRLASPGKAPPMSNVRDIHRNGSAERQASEWLVLMEAGEPSAEDRARFEAWLSEPGHRSAYAELKGTWGRLHALAGRTTLREALAAADMPAASVRRAGRRRLRLAAATAAAAALAIGLILGAVLLPPGGDETQYATRVGERSMVALSCGSTLELNTDTAVEVDYSGALRRVTLLRGEAYFRVAPDPARPFVVAAGPGTIR